MAFQHEPEQRKRSKPVDYDQLFPGRFIKAGELLGKKVTLTITDVDMEDLMGEDNKPKAKAIVAFKETEKQLVMCKTNGISLKAMFGKKLSEWLGKRVTLFPDTWNGEPCTRVWGSPDIQQDIEVEIALPRRRPFKKTMHAMGTGKANGAGKTSVLPPVPASIASLQAARNPAELDAVRESIWNGYDAAGQEVPQALLDAYEAQGEKVGQSEGLGV